MMRNKILTVTVAGAALLALGSPVPGAAAGQGPSKPNVASKKLDASKSEHNRVVSYWTPSRMRAALPGDALVADRDKSSATGQVAAGAPVLVKAPDRPRPGGGRSGYSGGYYSGAGKVVQTTGKVFFTLNEANYVCSGSSAASFNESVVVTAGHCVNSGAGTFVTNFAFVPGYDDGARPYGTFTATELLTTSQWSDSGDLGYDVGFAVVGTANDLTLQDAVGSQSIAFNQPRGQLMHSFGYPQAAPYDGSDIAWCWGTVRQDTFGGSTAQGLTCNLTGGASGGPWFAGFDTSTGVGTLSSLNSFKYEGRKLGAYIWGPYFGSVVETVYTSAAS